MRTSHLVVQGTHKAEGHIELGGSIHSMYYCDIHNLTPSPTSSYALVSRLLSKAARAGRVLGLKTPSPGLSTLSLAVIRGNNDDQK